MTPPPPGFDVSAPSGAQRSSSAGITADDKVEIAATFLGSFILGASFAKDFLVHGRFEIRMFLLGVSCFVLFIVIALVARIRIHTFDRRRVMLSLGWSVVFAAGNASAIDLFSYQFLSARLDGDIRLETMLFLGCYGLSTNLLFLLNRVVLLAALQQKTVYKYVLAPVNGLSGGAIVAGVIVWAFR
jgi:hypothetical protein